ncbi:RHS repeat-associated core domain-containing protein [Amycolatopsis thermoflava]|uniref:RHS repeat-associated core domain-containing protein n=1 Tax=Amycolatopsis thermoflava TaxID=84480 RepID=UPI000406B148|nr:RHS repeat-associated core domain-containing protein [Amycolatopsis thermoflava]
MTEGNPLVAAPVSTTTGVTGIGILESAQDLSNGIKDGSWVEGGLGALGTGLEVLSMVIDPLGTLAQYGVAWLIEHVRPLKEALDWLAGDPPVIQSFADTWANVAAEVGTIAGDLGNEVNNGTAGWSGQAADTYRGAGAEQADALAGAAALADGISSGVMIMGTVVGFVREMVRDIVAELVGKLITWALEAACTLGFATPLIAAQATTAISSAVTRIADFIRKLVKTIGNVSPRISRIISKLDEIIQQLTKIGRKLGGDGTTPSAAHGGGGKVDTPDLNSPDTPDSPDGVDGTPGTPGTGRSGDGSGSPLRQDAEDPDLRSQEPVGRCGRREPIDMATGEMYLVQKDVQLPGLLPLVLQRVHVSSYRSGRLFGPSWASTLDQRLEVDERGVCYAGPDGVILVYPHPPADGEVYAEAGARWPLARAADGGYMIRQPQSGRVLRFAPARGGTAELTAIEERADRIEFDRDPSGMPVAVRHSGGYQVDVRTSDGRVAELSLHDPASGGIPLVRYGYDDGHLVEVVNSSGRPLRFAYDHAGRITRWDDRNGEWYAYTYDHRGRCVRTEGSGDALAGTLEYDVDNRVTTETNSLGHVRRYHFNEFNQLVREIDPLGGETRFEWDRYHRLLAHHDQLGRTTRYRYDDRGSLTEVTRPDGTRALIEYNDQGLPVTAVDPDGSVWRYEYDDSGNRTLVVDPAGGVTRYGYDASGHLATITDHFGNVVRRETDRAGLLTALTDPGGGVTRYRRDQFGRVTVIEDPVGGETHLRWTVEGKLLSRTSPDGTTERWRYDGEGNEVERVDANGNVTRVEMTHFDAFASQTGPDGARFDFVYDSEMKLRAVRDPLGAEWRYEYDAAGRLVAETDFTGRTISYERDAAGQLVSRTNGAGETTVFVRDALGNIVERRSRDAVATFEYDPAGRLVRARNADADVRFERDAAGRVLAETINGHSTVFAYDALGRRTYRRTPSGAESFWNYGAGHRPASLRTGGRTFSFGFDAAGREIERLLDSGTALAQTWTPTHRLNSQTVTGVADRATGTMRHLYERRYHYRPDGVVRAVEDDIAGVRRYELDANGRVEQVGSADGHERYSYDAAGNIRTAEWPDTDVDGQGRRDYRGTLLVSAGRVRYGYDRQGRITLRQKKRLSAKPDTWHYAWNSEDRLTSVITPDGTRWRYLYDALGRRIAKLRLAADGVTVAERTDFFWDGSVLAEQISSDATAISWEHEPGGKRPLAQVERVFRGDGSQQWFDRAFYAIVTDLAGAPTELVDASGAVAWQGRRTLWGKAPENRAGTPLRFAGQYFDPETGMHYNFQRYYDPESGRYASNDPLGLEGGFNPQAYVPNPVTWIDPLGLTAADGCGPDTPDGDGDEYVPLYKAPQRGLGQQQYEHGYRADDYGGTGPWAAGAFFARDRELADTYAGHYGEGVIEIQVPASDYADRFEPFEQPYQGGPLTEVEIPASRVEELNQYPRKWHR